MPSSPVTPPDAPILPFGKETFATITNALCTPLKGHQPDPILIRSAADIASVCERLMEAMPEAHQTPDRVKLVERASGHLLFGLANFCHRALIRARASLEEALTWPDAPELHKELCYGACVANNVIIATR